MNEERWFEAEYTSLREETKWRIGFLHQTISLAIILSTIFTITAFIIIALGVSREILHTYLLIIPVVMSMLGFNYQSNQNSLESIPQYFEKFLKPTLEKKYKIKILEWDRFFASQKKPFKFESVTKIFPFIAPSVIPIYFAFSNIPLEKYQWVMIFVNFLLLFIMIEHFRYKLRRVK